MTLIFTAPFIRESYSQNHTGGVTININLRVPQTQTILVYSGRPGPEAAESFRIPLLEDSPVVVSSPGLQTEWELTAGSSLAPPYGKSPTDDCCRPGLVQLSSIPR